MRRDRRNGLIVIHRSRMHRISDLHDRIKDKKVGEGTYAVVYKGDYLVFSRSDF